MKTFKVESISHTYEILWSASKRNIEHARTVDRGSLYFYFTSMLMAYFSYEAYLNHVLLMIAPDLMGNERILFSKDPYRGTEGKLRKICELSNVEFPSKDEEPYKSIVKLKKLRDFSAHGKTEVSEKIVEAESGEDLPFIHSTFKDHVSTEMAEAVLPKVEEFIVSLNNKVRKNVHCEGLDEFPLQGFLGHASASETPA